MKCLYLYFITVTVISAAVPQDLCETCVPTQDCPLFENLNITDQLIWMEKFPCGSFPKNNDLKVPAGFASAAKGDYVCCSHNIWGVEHQVGPQISHESLTGLQSHLPKNNDSYKNYNNNNPPKGPDMDNYIKNNNNNNTLSHDKNNPINSPKNQEFNNYYDKNYNRTRQPQNNDNNYNSNNITTSNNTLENYNSGDNYVSNQYTPSTGSTVWFPDRSRNYDNTDYWNTHNPDNNGSDNNGSDNDRRYWRPEGEEIDIRNAHGPPGNEARPPILYNAPEEGFYPPTRNNPPSNIIRPPQYEPPGNGARPPIRNNPPRNEYTPPIQSYPPGHGAYAPPNIIRPPIQYGPPGNERRHPNQYYPGNDARSPINESPLENIARLPNQYDPPGNMAVPPNQYYYPPQNDARAHIQNNPPGSMSRPPYQYNPPRYDVIPPVQNYPPGNMVTTPIQYNPSEYDTRPTIRNNPPGNIVRPPVQYDPPGNMARPPFNYDSPEYLNRPPYLNMPSGYDTSRPPQYYAPEGGGRPPRQNYFPGNSRPPNECFPPESTGPPNEYFSPGTTRPPNEYVPPRNIGTPPPYFPPQNNNFRPDTNNPWDPYYNNYDQRNGRNNNYDLNNSNPYYTRYPNNVHNQDNNLGNFGSGQCRLTSFPPDPQSDCCGRQLADDDRITGWWNNKPAFTNQWTPPRRSGPIWRSRRSIAENDTDTDVTVENRIAGGHATELNQYPWTVLLLTTFDYGKREAAFNCGGGLLSAKYVLTAGHCVYDKDAPLKSVQVNLAEYDKNTFPRDCKSTRSGRRCVDNIVMYAEEVITHPQYENENLVNDIALLRLKGSAPYTEYIRPICLPTINIDEPQFSDLQFEVSGWGRVGPYSSNIKQSTVLHLVNHNECKRYYPQLTNKHLCAAGKRGEDTCKGDSGGPLMILYRGRYYVAGIVSGKRADSPCGTTVPSLYTNVYHYVSWIHSIIRN